ncbi:syntaxin-like protein [Vairimorpha necatrix]|uniref:Syntaxin-like protein n=1 Tax=Vairimorpha necatrix TaxID=6039 RepID=A0AAX4J879_9MICR
MDEFLTNSKNFFSEVNKLKGYTLTFEHLGARKNNGYVDEKSEKKINSQMEAINNKFRKVSTDLKNNLENSTSELSSNNVENFEYKTKKIHVHSQTKALTSAINEFRDVQYRYKKEEEEKFKLQFSIAKPDANEKEINECISEDRGEAILASAFALGSNSAKGILDEAKKRKTNIQKIAKIIQELIEMLNILNNAIYAQHDVVDDIGQDLTTAHENTEAANVDLNAALDYQTRASRIKRILFGIVITIIIVAVVFVVVKLAFNTGYYPQGNEFHYFF